MNKASPSKKGEIILEDGYYIQASQCIRDICMRIKDSIMCSDGSNMIIKIEILLKVSENKFVKSYDPEGQIKLSVVKIKTDHYGTPILFSKIEKTDCCRFEDLEFSETYDECKFKKEIISNEPHDKYCLDISFKELTRHSKKTVSTDKSYGKKIYEENEVINSCFTVVGKINSECFSDKAEGDLSLNYNKQITSAKGCLLP